MEKPHTASTLRLRPTRPVALEDYGSLNVVGSGGSTEVFEVRVLSGVNYTKEYGWSRVARNPSNLFKSRFNRLA